MPDRDPDMVISPLSRTIAHDGMTVEVEIYRRITDPAWTFKVLTHEGLTIQWTEDFESDEEALRAFEDDLERDGIASYLADAPTTCPRCRALGL